ncbi:MAG TPA: 2-amino-4-hydroxy-6-hydroxymethyldihydropteridine diphosphokinase [Acidobacteriaceae bacterium]|nr:2-amino-4-hydroxy-6-hydroxymethyldihydropteridine diphosphokinase [Acidobacteriaceae bacterium]
MRYRVYVGLGSNVASAAGSPEETVRVAVHALEAAGKVTAVSSLYRTAPVGYTEQPDFINAVACVETGWTPEELMHELLALEHSFGRDRRTTVPKGPRTLDLDILLAIDQHGGVVVHTSPVLTLPHPELARRRFVLEPLAEIAPEATVPGTGIPGKGKTVRELAEELRHGGKDEVVRLER